MSNPIPSRTSHLAKKLAASLMLISAVACTKSSTDNTASTPLSWQEIISQPLPTARHENALGAIGHQLYLLGGRGDRPLEIFDTHTGTWRKGATPPLEIHHMQAITYEGKLFILGALTGGFPEETPLANVLIYDPATDRWDTGPEIPENRRRGASGVVLHNGLIYVVGGNTRGHMSGYVPWLDVLDPATGRWTSLPDAPHARDHFHAAVIDGRVYAAAGRTTAHDTGNALTLTLAPMDVYDIASGRWSTLEAPLPTLRAGAATLAVDGKLLVIGGESGTQVPAHNEVEMFDPAQGTWHTLPPLPVGRHGTQAILVGDDLHIVSGSGNRGGGPELTDHWILKGFKAP